MNRIFTLIVILSMLFSTACSGLSQAAVPVPDIPEVLLEETNAAAETSSPSEEVARALSYGLVPEEIQGDYTAVITFRQYSEMLTNLIRIWDESRLGEW